jgi:hypothetical protein
MTDPLTPIFNLLRPELKQGWTTTLIAGFKRELVALGVEAAREAPQPPAQPQSGSIWHAGAGTAQTGATELKNEAAFYDALRGSLFRGGLTVGQLEGVKALLAAMGEARWSLAWTAYGFATPFLETAKTMQPIKEYGGTAYFTRMYDLSGERPAKARELGNVQPGDGPRFCGRGYVQLTGRTNYSRASAATGVDLIADPDAAMRADVAAKVLIWGMSAGAFTGKKLGDYLPDRLGTLPQFTQARRIINGQDRAAEIAADAVKFQDALVAGEWA